MLVLHNNRANGERARRGAVNGVVDVVLVLEVVAEHVGRTEAHEVLEVAAARLELLVVVATCEATFLLLGAAVGERLLER